MKTFHDIKVVSDKYFIFIACIVATAACAKPPANDSPSSSSSSPARYLYVASGLCQAGGNTTFTATSSSNVVFRVNLANGTRDMILADYNGASGETPVGIAPYDAGNILVMIERAGSRRIEKVAKAPSGTRAPFSAEVAAGQPLSNTLVSLQATADGSYLVSRTNAIGLLGSSGLTQIGSYVGTAPGGVCGTTNTKYSTLGLTNQGHLITMNSEASDNRIGLIRNGTQCLDGQVGPATTALSTVALWIPDANQILAAYSGTTTADNINSLQVYAVTETPTTATVGAATEVYDAFNYPATYPYLLYGVSAMARDSATGYIYIASANQAAANIATAGNYLIEKFSYNSTTKALTRIGNASFYPSGVDTKCISAMFVAD